MKKILIGALTVASAFTGSAAFAGQTEDTLARLDALEKENAAIRRENAALSENKLLREQNAALKSSIPRAHSAPPAVTRQLAAKPLSLQAQQPVAVPAQAQQQPAAVTTPAPAAELATVAAARPASISDRMADFFGAYAADLPVAYKARVETPGQFRVWGEGGAIWTGGDPVSQDFNLTDFSSLFGVLLGNGSGGGVPGSIDLTPKIGWEAATGFDYRFAGSPWHVSGQFRYGEGGKTSGSVATAGMVDPTILAFFIGGGGGGCGPFCSILSIGGSEGFTARYKETHWIADLAVGRDVLGNGPDAMQVKGGLRISEFVGTRATADITNRFFNFSAPVPIFGPGSPTVSSVNETTSTVTNQRNSFLGIGPRVGIEGTVPFAGKWGFEYLGDVALLFGTQKSLNSSTSITTISPAFLNVFGGNNTQNSFTNERFGTVFNGDIQIGISYWITQNVKMTGSYRLDAWINVQNQDTTPVTNLTPDRYTHGPRLAVMGQF